VRQAGKVYADSGNGRASGSKSQKGRWRGLDEDISDDQVVDTYRRVVEHLQSNIFRYIFNFWIIICVNNTHIYIYVILFFFWHCAGGFGATNLAFALLTLTLH
jgi:hypothetical protein